MYDYIGVYVEGTSTNVNDDEFTDGEISDDSGSTENGMNYAEEVLYYCNIKREKAGVSPFVLDETLCSAAEVRAGEIVSTFSHARPDGRKMLYGIGKTGADVCICRVILNTNKIKEKFCTEIEYKPVFNSCKIVGLIFSEF